MQHITTDERSPHLPHQALDARKICEHVSPSQYHYVNVKVSISAGSVYNSLGTSETSEHTNKIKLVIGGMTHIGPCSRNKPQSLPQGIMLSSQAR